LSSGHKPRTTEDILGSSSSVEYAQFGEKCDLREEVGLDD